MDQNSSILIFIVVFLLIVAIIGIVVVKRGGRVKGEISTPLGGGTLEAKGERDKMVGPIQSQTFSLFNRQKAKKQTKSTQRQIGSIGSRQDIED